MLIFAMHQKQKNPRKVLIYRDFLCFAILSSGETGIRTPGTLLKALQRYDFILNMQDF